MSDSGLPIDLEHVRRGRRVIELLILRFGVAHFMEKKADARLEGQLEQRQEARAVRTGRDGRVSTTACEDAISLARSWIERRTGRSVNETEVRLLRRALRQLLHQRIREGAACVHKR